MKKILFLTPQYPFPLDNGGKKGCFNGLEILDGLFDVDVLSFIEDQKYYIKNKNYGFKTINFIKPIKHDIHIRKKPLKLLLSIVRDLLTKTPYIVTKYKRKEMFKLIDKIFKNGNFYKYIFIDYMNMSLYLKYIVKKYNGNFDYIIFKDHNIEYELVRQEYNSSKGIKKIFLCREWKLTRMYEMQLVRSSNICFSVCEENTKWLKTINNFSYTMLPVYRNSTIRLKKNTGKTIAYFGNLSWKANFEGLLWFIEKVFPIILSHDSKVKLVVAGSGLKTDMFSKYNENIIYLGYVDDPKTIYDMATVMIVPLFEGSGIRIKILDAFNNGVPVVSTLVGCGSINAKNNKEIIIANNEEEFSNAVLLLINDNKFNYYIAKNAKNLIINDFSIENRKKELTKALESHEKVNYYDYKQN